MSATDVLFDEPGPRARRRIRIATIAGLVLGGVALALAIRQFAVNGQLDADMWAPYGTWPMWRYLLDGLASTALAAALAVAIAAALGLLLALARVSRFAVPRGVGRAYVEVVRVIPALLLIYVMMFLLPAYGLNLPVLWKLVVPLAISHAAQFAEIFRAGILSLAAGQGEAASALGLRRWQGMRYVVLPQALRRVVPSLVSQTVSLLKDTSLGYLLGGFMELLLSAKVLANFNHLLIQTYLVVALVYFVVNYSLSRFARWLQARQGRTGSTGTMGVPAMAGAPGGQ